MITTEVCEFSGQTHRSQQKDITPTKSSHLWEVSLQGQFSFHVTSQIFSQ